MQHLDRCVTGSVYFESLEEPDPQAFIETLAALLIELAEAGYYHRDLHLDNLLVDGQQRLTWIDTYIKKLPSSKEKRAALLEKSITHSRINSPAHRAQLQGYLEGYF